MGDVVLSAGGAAEALVAGNTADVVCIIEKSNIIDKINNRIKYKYYRTDELPKSKTPILLNYANFFGVACRRGCWGVGCRKCY